MPARKNVNPDGSWVLEPEKGMRQTVPKKDVGKLDALERRSLRQLQKDLVMLVCIPCYCSCCGCLPLMISFDLHGLVFVCRTL